MPWNSTQRLCALTAGVLVALAGCQERPPALTPVCGHVYYQGRPLSQGMIVFTPDVQRGGSGPSATGDIQSDGAYTLTTDGQPGAVLGWHRVTLAALAAEPAGPGATYPRSLLPARYADPELSGQRQEIKSGKENIIDFRLE